jgi:hypothetical protein
VVDHEHSVGRLTHIEFNAVDAEIDRGAKCTEGIFSQCAVNTTVSEDRRHASSQARDQELQPREIGQITQVALVFRIYFQ